MWAQCWGHVAAGPTVVVVEKDDVPQSRGCSWQLATLTAKGTGTPVLGELSGGSTCPPRCCRALGLLFNLTGGEERCGGFFHLGGTLPWALTHPALPWL